MKLNETENKTKTNKYTNTYHDWLIQDALLEVEIASIGGGFGFSDAEANRRFHLIHVHLH